MNPDTQPALMTTEEMLALPGKKVDRELIGGRLRERPVTFHDRWHSQTLARLGHLLVSWLEKQSEPRGDALIGAGFRLHRDPDTSVWIDLTYVRAGIVRNTPL